MRYVVKKDPGSLFVRVIDTNDSSVVKQFKAISNGWERADRACNAMNEREKPKVGGKREGAGRPAPLGRKEVCSVRLTPDVAEFCRQHPDGFTVLEEKLRASKEFRDWLKAKK